jgi:hypothetical protein
VSKPTKFGWCLDSNHSLCPGLLRHSMGIWEVTVCHCKCHGENNAFPVKRSA